MSKELTAIAEQCDGLVRSVTKICARIYSLDLTRQRQRDVLYALRRSLNNATRYQREPDAPLVHQFNKPTEERMTNDRN